MIDGLALRAARPTLTRAVASHYQGSHLVLTERNEHLDRLEQGLSGGVRHLVALRAGLGKRQRQALTERLAAIPRDQPRVILATGRYVGEGFDDPRLDMPSDPVWKRDYSGSVRRLVRDGVNAPLASLFVHVARAVQPDADGALRARSSSEAFLFRRLPGTRGRFSVNQRLPLPFDGAGGMEVDLLCADARVVVELDGGQHLADPAAYRRDRRKDQLLQENGYFVLRFLAEDIGKELDMVLDAILRALRRRGTSASPEVPLHVVRGR